MYSHVLFHGPWKLEQRKFQWVKIILYEWTITLHVYVEVSGLHRLGTHMRLCVRVYIYIMIIIISTPDTKLLIGEEKLLRVKWRVSARLLAALKGRDSTEELGKPLKTKSSQITSRLMVKENGGTFPKLQVVMIRHLWKEHFLIYLYALFVLILFFFLPFLLKY